MKITATTGGKRMVTTTIVDKEVPFNVRTDSPAFYPETCINIDMGYDSGNRSVCVRMSIEEARRLLGRLESAISRAENMIDKP
jgi:hypothetical protein